jgi:hypothetical protein
MRPESCRDIRPGRAASGQPEHGIEHHPVILWWSAGLGLRNQIFDPVPLSIGQLIPPCCHKITPMRFSFILLHFSILCTFYMMFEFSDTP